MRAGRPRSQVGILPSLLLLQGVRDCLPDRSPFHSAEPSRLVALRRPSWPLVDNSFFLLFHVRPAPDRRYHRTTSPARISSTLPSSRLIRKAPCSLSPAVVP